MVEAEERPDQAVVALSGGDAGVGARDGGVDLPLLRDVGVLHQEGVADLGLAPHLVGGVVIVCVLVCGGKEKGRAAAAARKQHYH
jgi:hypothetical protein